MLYLLFNNSRKLPDRSEGSVGRQNSTGVSLDVSRISVYCQRMTESNSNLSGKNPGRCYEIKMRTFRTVNYDVSEATYTGARYQPLETGLNDRDSFQYDCDILEIETWLDTIVATDLFFFSFSLSEAA